MKARNSVAWICSFFFLMSLYIYCHLMIKETREQLVFHPSSQGIRIPSQLLQLLAGEFKGLMADYLVLEVGSFIGANQKINEEDWDNITSSLKQALDLDPWFQQTYIFVQGNLPWRTNMADKAIRLLDVSRKHRTWDWRPGYYMGFDSYYFLKDYERASELFLETAKIKNAPVLLAVLGARFAARTGRTETAIILLKAMLEELDSEAELEPGEEAKKKEIQNRLSALYGVSYLEKAITSFKNNYNVYPESLEVLLKAGFISEIPLNPYGTSYYYDPTTGTVNFDKIH